MTEVSFAELFARALHGVPCEVVPLPDAHGRGLLVDLDPGLAEHCLSTTGAVGPSSRTSTSRPLPRRDHRRGVRPRTDGRGPRGAGARRARHRRRRRGRPPDPVGVVLHDLLLAPVLGLAGLALPRVLPPVVRGPVVAGAVVLGTVTLVAVPVLGRFGAVASNPTLLDRPYVEGWLAVAGVVAGAVAGVVVAGVVAQVWRGRVTARG